MTMHIPTTAAARQLLDGLDPERRDVAEAISRRFGTLPPEHLQDDKVLRQAFMLELQARCSPDLAAKIAYTSEEVLIPLAVALVHARARHAAHKAMMDKLYKVALVVVVLLLLCLGGYFIFRAPAPAEPTVSPAPQGQPTPSR